MVLHSPHNFLSFIWLRFIDDIFMLWTHASSSLTTFLQHINTFHLTIKFSHTQSHTSINFLDTTILPTKQRTLQSTLYIKPTDKGLLLHHASHHLTACKKDIIYSQALRYQRIITDDHDVCLHLQRLHKILLARGYSYSNIITAINKATSHTQSQLLQHRPLPSTTGVHIPFLIPYNTESKEQNRIMDWEMSDQALGSYAESLL